MYLFNIIHWCFYTDALANEKFYSISDSFWLVNSINAALESSGIDWRNELANRQTNQTVNS